jgi:hypothetical protein
MRRALRARPRLLHDSSAATGAAHDARCEQRGINSEGGGEHHATDARRQEPKGVTDVVERERRIVPAQYPTARDAALAVAHKPDEAAYGVDEDGGPQRPLAEKVLRGQDNSVNGHGSRLNLPTSIEEQKT